MNYAAFAASQHIARQQDDTGMLDRLIPSTTVKELSRRKVRDITRKAHHELRRYVCKANSFATCGEVAGAALDLADMAIRGWSDAMDSGAAEDRMRAFLRDADRILSNLTADVDKGWKLPTDWFRYILAQEYKSVERLSHLFVGLGWTWHNYVTPDRESDAETVNRLERYDIPCVCSWPIPCGKMVTAPNGKQFKVNWWYHESGEFGLEDQLDGVEIRRSYGEMCANKWGW